MRYIDKNINKAAGNQVTLDYLNAHCKDASGHYGGVRYSTKDAGTNPIFLTSGSPNTYYSRMVDILMRDQKERCCYCLRKLQPSPAANTDAKISIEHIVPHSFTHADYAKFAEYKSFTHNLDEVVLTDDFESMDPQTIPPYPHTVAYENMVVSCNGTFPAVREGGRANSQICCNHKRGAERALPVYFLNDIANHIVYLNTGDVQANASSPQCSAVDEVIKHADLGCDSLCVIRKIWYELSALDLSNIIQCDTEDKREKLLTEAFNNTLAMTDPIATADLIEKFKKQDYWETLMLYDAFYDIMKAKYRATVQNSNNSSATS